MIKTVPNKKLIIFLYVIFNMASISYQHHCLMRWEYACLIWLIWLVWSFLANREHLVRHASRNKLLLGYIQYINNQKEFIKKCICYVSIQRSRTLGFSLFYIYTYFMKLKYHFLNPENSEERWYCVIVFTRNKAVAMLLGGFWYTYSVMRKTNNRPLLIFQLISVYFGDLISPSACNIKLCVIICI